MNYITDNEGRQWPDESQAEYDDCHHEEMGDDMSEYDDEPEYEGWPHEGVMGMDDDADALASAGFGTDEDYGCFDSGDDWF